MNILLEFLLLGAIAAICVFGFKFLKARLPDNSAYKFAVGVALVAAFLLFWVNGAVGIIGSENEDANMLYFGVLAVGFIGALIARFRPAGMALALFATAFAMVLVALIAVAAGFGSGAELWPRDILGITAFFAALFAGSGFFFRKAAAAEQTPSIG